MASDVTQLGRQQRHMQIKDGSVDVESIRVVIRFHEPSGGKGRPQRPAAFVNTDPLGVTDMHVRSAEWTDLALPPEFPHPIEEPNSLTARLFDGPSHGGNVHTERGEPPAFGEWPHDR